MHAHDIQINEEGIKAFWEKLGEDDWNKFHQEHGAKFPLKYSDPLDELNFLSYGGSICTYFWSLY